MSERCHRCYTILTSEDKYWYEIACESCETDLKWEDHERDQLIKSAHYKWRAVCFCVRWMQSAPFAAGNLCVRYVRCRLDERRKLQHVRRGR